ncbi:MAG: ABC transporter substrate-binding protein, partial [Pseudomonadota bacterium]|nr:ABC transporter substrate-binding protein [Pseudomonadota bacterium]
MSACSQEQWNQPYSKDQIQSPILFSSFSESPKHLDPVVSYNSNEWAILSQVYEPPLQYHYLKRPYTLEPLTLTSMPQVQYLNKNGDIVENQTDIVFSEYTLTLKPDIQFQPHPAFVKTAEGSLKYADLSDDQLNAINSISDFKDHGSRELTADDYVYAIKRMGVRQNHSPVLDTMQEYIVGLDHYSKTVSADYKTFAKENDEKSTYFELKDYSISGIEVIDKYSFKIRIKSVYPQFQYWLSMNFFAPIAWEVDQFYKQAGLVEKNLTLDTSPVGTGAYMLVENNPNKQMRLLANPNYHHEVYPIDGLAEGANPKLLNDAGKTLPFIK